MQREPGEVIFFRGHPSWRSITPYWLRGVVLMLVLGVLAGVVSVVVQGRVGDSWVVIAVLVTFALRVARGRMRLLRRTYAITNRRLTIETGLWSRRLYQARLERIEDINVSQSMLERALDVGTVDFYTAAKPEFSFHGVDDPRRIARTVDRALYEARIGH